MTDSPHTLTVLLVADGGGAILPISQEFNSFDAANKAGMSLAQALNTHLADMRATFVCMPR